MFRSARLLPPSLAVLPLLLLLGCGGDPAPSPPEETAPAAPAPAPVSESASESAAASDTEGPSDPFGYYFLVAKESLPVWTESIDHLHLSTIDMRGDQMVTVPLYGFIRSKPAPKGPGVDYPLVEPQRNGSRLIFTTQEIEGISFEFDGRFLKSGSFPENPPDPESAVLTGKLRQRQGGRLIGEMDAEFRYEPGD